MTTLDALAEGFKDGGLELVTNYPGFHSHELFARLGGKHINTNERVAFQVAFGASLAGKRSLVTMKGLGLNNAADEFLHSTISGVRAGFALVVTDDVEVSASQERFDSRHYLSHYGGLCFEPSTPQQAYDIAHASFSLSEQFDVPILIRLTNQFFTGSGSVSRLPATKTPDVLPPLDRRKYIIHPVFWKDQYHWLSQKMERIRSYCEANGSVFQKGSNASHTLTVVSGNCDRELRLSDLAGADQLRILTYPIPSAAVQQLLPQYERVVIFEQGSNFIYREVRLSLNYSDEETMLASNTGFLPDFSSTWRNWDSLRALFTAISSAGPSFVIGDVGQYTVETTDTIQACLCLGAAVGVTMGVAVAGFEYPFCVVGDTAFVHGGMSALEEAYSRGVKMCVIVIDNGGSWSTGNQPTAVNIRNINPAIRRYEVSYDSFSEDGFTKELKGLMRSKDLVVIYVTVIAS